MLQLLATLVAFAVLALWPPLSGRLLLVAIDGSDRNALAVAALAGGAALIGRGPWPGSLVVEGDRATVAARAQGQRFLILAAPAAGCGTALFARAGR